MYKKKGSKNMKPKPGCPFLPTLFIEPSLTDIETKDGNFVWEGNPLCAGNVYTDEANCDRVGAAYGVCTTLALGDDCDSVDSWLFTNDEDETIGTLISRGITGDIFPESVVIGGTGCFENASGTIKSTESEDEVTGLEAFTYDLSNVRC